MTRDRSLFVGGSQWKDRQGMSLYRLAGEQTTPVLCSTANKQVLFLLEFSIGTQPFGSRMQPVRIFRCRC